MVNLWISIMFFAEYNLKLLLGNYKFITIIVTGEFNIYNNEVSFHLLP